MFLIIMKVNKKYVLFTGIVLGIILALYIGISVVFQLYGFETCKLLGGKIYTGDAPFSGAQECHLGNESYNEADSWETEYPQNFPIDRK